MNIGIVRQEVVDDVQVTFMAETRGLEQGWTRAGVEEIYLAMHRG